VSASTVRARSWAQLGRQLRAGGLFTALVAAAATVLVAPAPAFAAVPGLTYINANTGFDSNVYKSVTVSCPAGTNVVGGGYDLVGAEGAVVLDDFIPSSTSLTVGAGEVVGPGEPSDGTRESWQVRATAVCASPLPGYTIVPNTSVFARGTSRAVTANCPTGTFPVGAGASLSNGFGQVSISDLTYGDGSVSAGAVDDEDGYSGSWSVTAYAICASRLPGLHVVTTFSEQDSSSLHSAGAYCPAGQQVLGAGWSVFLGSSVVARQLLNIHADVSGGGVSPGVTGLASEDANGYGGDWRMYAQAVCADG
jgi:hypothetical protein